MCNGGARVARRRCGDELRVAEAWATACSAAPRTAATGFLLRPRLVVACVAEAASVVNGIGNTPFHGRCISDSAHALDLASVRVQIRECVGLATSRTENDAGSAVVEQDKTHLALWSAAVVLSRWLISTRTPMMRCATPSWIATRSWIPLRLRKLRVDVAEIDAASRERGARGNRRRFENQLEA